MNGDLTLSFFNTFEQERSSFTLNVDPTSIIEDGADDTVFKLAAKANIDHLNRVEIHDLKAEGKFSWLTLSDEMVGDKDISELRMYNSLKYSVLAKETAFFGKIKNKDKSGEEMKKIEIPIRKMLDSQMPNTLRPM